METAVASIIHSVSGYLPSFFWFAPKHSTTQPFSPNTKDESGMDSVHGSTHKIAKKRGHLVLTPTTPTQEDKQSFKYQSRQSPRAQGSQCKDLQRTFPPQTWIKATTLAQKVYYCFKIVGLYCFKAARFLRTNTPFSITIVGSVLSLPA
jgi:hypothetical protein